MARNIDDTLTGLDEILAPPSPIIFLSYAREDAERVKAVYRKLRTQQLNPWLDVADLLPGQEWEKAIVNVIRNARFVIVFLSGQSVSKRGYVQKEIKEALDMAERMPDGDIYIIPVRLEECAVPERLAKWQWIDIFRPHGFKRLVQMLKDNLGPVEAGPAEPADAKLVAVGMSDHARSFQLNKVATLLGRSVPGANVIPDIDLARFDRHRSVSRSHALIVRVGNSFIVKDCGSRNGTVINEVIRLNPSQSRILRSGDSLRLGRVILFFICGG